MDLKLSFRVCLSSIFAMFNLQGFAEIAFCAITASEQVGIRYVSDVKEGVVVVQC